MNLKYFQRSKMESMIPKAMDPTDTAVDIPGRQPLLHVWLFTSSVDSAGRDIVRDSETIFYIRKPNHNKLHVCYIDIASTC